jgi:hypothetical protein
MKIRTVGAQLFHAEGGKDGQLFFAVLPNAYKSTYRKWTELCTLTYNIGCTTIDEHRTESVSGANTWTEMNKEAIQNGAFMNVSSGALSGVKKSWKTESGIEV